VGLHAHGVIFVEACRNAYPLVTPVAIGRSIVLALAVLLVGSLALAAPAPKAAKKSSAPNLSSRVAEQKKQIDAQRSSSRRP
jgi:hypothetical protein